MSSVPTLRDHIRKDIVANLMGGDDGGTLTMRCDHLADDLTEIVALMFMDVLGLHDWAESYYCSPAHRDGGASA